MKPSRRSTKRADSSGSKVTGTIDTVDGIVLQNGSPNESTKKSDAFMVDFDDRSSKEDDMISKKSPMKKSSNDVRVIFFSFAKTRYTNVFYFIVFIA